MVKVLEVKKAKPKKESLIQKEILGYLREIGCKVDVIHSAGYHRNGMSDIVGCTAQGHFIAVEVKRPGGRLTALQRQYLEEKKNCTGIAFVASSVEDCKTKLVNQGAVL